MARRVLALILLGLALIVCVVLAASESLRNRTGRTATAVTVTFSKRVTITGYNSSVFTTQEPTAKAESFRFSGGQLEDGGRFMISWSPSDAVITNAEWEVPAAPAAAGPLTYDQIMAQIAHYPGPDEPLYVPAEGEQIWLTDLEGHTDIYDNDSIKINYAPGFDKSQITKIEVYRNGVKMRFVPALFDVLTNEQMKTFDGNPTERTPVSGHTDHAIFGYEYSFKFSAASPFRTLAARIKSGITWHPTYVYAYLLGTWGDSILAYDDASLVRWFGQLHDTGVTGISLDYNLYVNSLDAVTVVAQYDQHDYPPMWIGPPLTPTLEAYEHAVACAKQAGLEVEFRGHIYTSNRYWWENGSSAWTGELEPSNPSAFFNSLFEHVRPILEMCERYGVERADLLTEMCALELHTGAVKAFLDRVAGIFSGQLGIETVATENMNGVYPEFWDWTFGERRLTVNLSAWNPPIETQYDQRVSEMVRRFIDFIAPLFAHYSRDYPDLDIAWGEAGTYPIDGVAMGPQYFVSDPNGHVPARLAFDGQEYNDVLASLLVASQYLRVDGICIWFFVPFDAYSLKTENSFISTSSPTMHLISSMIVP